MCEKDLNSWGKAFMNNSEGLKKIKEVLKLFGFSSFSFEKGETEHESKFDEFGKGKIYDLVLWGSITDCHEHGKEWPLAVYIEEKADESFGAIMQEVLDDSCNDPESKMPERIEWLYKTLGMYNIPLDCINYQLMTWLAGALMESYKKFPNGSIVFMPIIVNHSNEYDEEKCIKNKQEFLDFMNIFNFVSDEKNGNTMFHRGFIDAAIYTAYIEI